MDPVIFESESGCLVQQWRGRGLQLSVGVGATPVEQVLALVNASILWHPGRQRLVIIRSEKFIVSARIQSFDADAVEGDDPGYSHEVGSAV